MANKEFIVRNGLIVGSNTFVVNATSNTVTVGGTIQATAIQVDGATIPSGATSNLVFDTANAAFGSGNTAGSLANQAGVIANSAYSHSNTTYAAVNSAFAVINAAFASANNVASQVAPSYNTANAAYGQANTARTHANSAFDVANAAFGSANNVAPQVAPAYNTANGGYAVANAAFGVANSALPKSGGTITGDLVVTGNATFSGTTTYANTQSLFIGDNILTLNADMPVSVAPSENAGIEVGRGSSANVSVLWNESVDKWTFTNDGTTYYQIASNTDVATVDSRLTSAYGVANAAYGQANTLATSANAYAASVGTSTNNYTSATYSTLTQFGSVFGVANGAFGAANSKVATVAGTSGRITSSGTTGITLDLATAGAGAASYSSGISALTVDAYGRVTAVTGSAGYYTSGGALGTPSSGNLANCTFPTLNQNTTGSAYYGFVQDTRNSVTGPNLGDKRVRFDFLANSTDGLSDGGSYHGVMSFQQWTDASGGGTRQLGFTDNDNLWIRGSGNGVTSYGSWKLFLNSSNYTGYSNFGTNSVYGGIFYDGNNTGYYSDPASTTNINALTLAGALTLNAGITAQGAANYLYNFDHGKYMRLMLPAAWNGAASGDAGLYFWISEPGATWTAAGIGRNRYNSGAGFPRVNTTLSAQMIRFEESDQITFSAITSGGTSYTHGYMTTGYIASDGSMRSPIFYDLNDTGYYANPNGDSYFNTIGAAGRFYTGYDSGVTNSVSCSNWFRSSGGSGWYNASYGGGIWMNDATYVQTYGSKIFLCDQSVRSPIFYDSNDAGYYVDPNATSHLLTAKVSHYRYGNLTYISKAGAGGIMLVQNGRIYTAAGNSGGTGNYTTGRGLNGQVATYGVEKFKSVSFPNETGSPTQYGTNGMAFAYALFANGNLYTWGWNPNGQLGLGNTTAYAIPTLSATGVTNVYSHPTNANRYPEHSHLIIRKTDGYLYSTGYNGNGQLGLGDTTNRSSWTQITALGTNILNCWNMGATWGITVVQKTDYTIWVCGLNNYGQLGRGNTTATNSFVDVTANWGGGSGYTLMKVIGGYGGYNSADYSDGWTGMLLDNGTTTVFRTCGRNAGSQLGDGTTTDRSTPVTPNVGSGRIADVASHGDGQGGSYVLKADGNVYSWGYNGYGTVGNGTTTNNATPTVNVSGVSALMSDGCVCYVQGYVAQGFIKKTDGYLYSIGYNGYGQLGIGDATNRYTWQRVWLPGDFYIQSLGWFATTYPVMIYIAQSTDGRLFAWGYNNQYALAADSTINAYIPYNIAPFLGG